MPSMTTIDRARDALQAELETGEVLEAASQAQLDGGTMRMASRIGAGAAGGVHAASIAAGTEPDDLGARLANGLVLAVTNRRLFLLDVTAVSARPKSVVTTIDRSRLADITTGDKRVMLVKLLTIAMTVRGDDGDQALRFEIPKTARRDGQAVVDVLRD